MRSLSHLTALVMLLAALVFPYAPARSAPAFAPGQSAFGVNSHIATRYPDPQSMTVPVDALAQAETGWVREDFQFEQINPQPDTYQWMFADAAVNALAGRGINIIGVLNGPTPAWAAGGNPGSSFFPPDPQAFARFAAAVVSRYRDRVHHWEVWNEPDNERYWQPAPDPMAYANLLKTTAQAIRATDPGARILVAGIVSPEPATTWLTTLANNGAWGAFDIVSIHPYTDPRGPEDGQIGAAGVGQVKALVERLGAKPIWATEFGWSTGAGGRGGVAFGEEDQASFLVRGAVMLRGAGVDRVIWYHLKDGTNAEDYGLFKFGGGYTDYAGFKPSYIAFKTLNQQVGAAAPIGTVDLAQAQTVLDFEQFGTWRRGDQPNGTLAQSGAQRHGGAAAAQLSYTFPDSGDRYVVFSAVARPQLPNGATRLGLWVYGDGGGSALKVWLRGAGGEVLQYRLGYVGAPGWQFLSAALTGQVEPFNRISGGGSGTLTFPARLEAIVLDNESSSVRTGTIFLDDLTALSGPEAYGIRFSRAGGDVVDVLWAPAGAQVSIPTSSPQGTLVDRWGTSRSVAAEGGRITVGIGPSPFYLTHVPGNAAAPQPAPAPPAPGPQPAPVPQPTAGQRCFAETGFCIGGRIREYWEQNGGLPVFGYPTTPQREELIEGRPFQVQWFERNRLELHPENPRPYDVLLGRLGADRLAQQQRDWMQFPKAQPDPACLYFAQTGHNVCGAILEMWRSNGLELDGRRGKTPDESLALFGLPISPPQVEKLSDGREYTVQWFERARFELHPENAPPYHVLLGLLGNETLQK